LEYFTIERPQLCLDALLNQHNHPEQQQSSDSDMMKKSACGSNLEPHTGYPHYSGNFWVATCEYLSSLPLMDLSDPNLNYVEAEMWIGKQYKPDQFVNLWKRQLDTDVGLYRHWIQPYEYRFPEDNVSTILPESVNL
jgi:hypothetical protein